MLKNIIKMYFKRNENDIQVALEMMAKEGSESALSKRKKKKEKF